MCKLWVPLYILAQESSKEVWTWEIKMGVANESVTNTEGAVTEITDQTSSALSVCVSLSVSLCVTHTRTHARARARTQTRETSYISFKSTFWEKCLHSIYPHTQSVKETTLSNSMTDIEYFQLCLLVKPFFKLHGEPEASLVMLIIYRFQWCTVM